MKYLNETATILESAIRHTNQFAIKTVAKAAGISKRFTFHTASHYILSYPLRIRNLKDIGFRQITI